MSTTQDPESKSDMYVRGALDDVKRVQQGGAATIEELREFLGQTRGKGPQEVLGMVAQSGLVRSTLLATVIVFVLLVVFTIIPYAVGDREQEKTKPVAAENTDEPDEPATAAATSPESSKGDKGNETTSSGDEKLDALGIGDAKSADPKKNPLENSLDNLLDKID